MTLEKMHIEYGFIILALFSRKMVKAEQSTIDVTRTEIETNYELVNCTVNLKIDNKSQKYGIDIDVDVRKPIDDLIVCILTFC